MKRRIFTAVIAIALTLFFVLSLFACSTPEPQNRIFYSSFDTVCVVWDYSGMETEEFADLVTGIENSAYHYHRLFDAYNEYSDVTNIATLNRLAGKGPVKVDRELTDLLLFSKEMYEVTGGKVNFALGAVTDLWKRLPATEKRIPTETELLEAGKHISPASVIIDEKNSTVEITDPLLRIDVGAIAKGYAAELIKNDLTALGYKGLVLDFGGNLCSVGEKQESAIRNPLYPSVSEEAYIRWSTLDDDSLVTSGVYERYVTIGGVNYHHIIDTVSLFPETRYLSVTVQTPHSGKADALSTAIFNMNYEDAKSFISSFEDELEVTFVFSSGEYEIVKN